MTNHQIEARWAAKFGGSVPPSLSTAASHLPPSSGGEDAQLARDMSDPQRLIKAVKKRCLERFGGYVEHGVLLGADGRPVTRPLAQPMTAQRVDDPQRLANAIRRRIQSSAAVGSGL